MRMTQAEVNAYEARRSKPGTGGETFGCEKESGLHNAILSECRRRGWIALHGSMASPTHRSSGEPDFLIVRDAIYHSKSGDMIAMVLFVECKSKAGKLSPAQQAFHAHARKLGHQIHVVRSFEEFIALL